ncbi:MAG: hypothetical protein LBM25_07230 [Bacteroidales bacterium]|jgi:hypothetical protein|nr:hypothetical protein [Bacteroidales bacterium]
MLEKLKKDNYLFGFLIGVGTTLVFAGLILGIMFVFGKEFMDDPKIVIFSIIPTLLLMRWYFKNELPKSGKAISLVVLISFLVFFFLMYNLGIINLSSL